MFDVQNRIFAARRLVPVLAFVAAFGVIAATAHAAGEIIPSIGWTKPTDSNGGDAKPFGGLAVRLTALPVLKLEGQIAYREDSHVGGIANVRQWPVTASAWFKPMIPLYAGGGIGWYHTTYDFPETVPIHDTTTERIGLHLGGGADVPISPQLGVDVNGRYIFMQRDNNNIQFPTSFNPDFWTVGVGLALKF